MKEAQPKRFVGERWTPLLMSKGWTPLSNFFLENYHRLQPSVTHAEVLLIIHLIFHKWDKNSPFPSLRKIAERMSISSTSIRNHVRSLEAKGYLRREYRTAQTNIFHLDGLFE